MADDATHLNSHARAAEQRAAALDMISFIDASPSPYHAVSEATRRLTADGWKPLDTIGDTEPPERGLVTRGGALVAWALPPGWRPGAGLRLVGAHTDSPNLRLRPRPDTGRAGWRQLSVEVYGGALVNSWLDRDLGLAGRVAVATASGDPELVPVRIDRPLLRVPQLAIHLDRQVNETGLVLDRQSHLTPVWGLGTPREGELAELLASEIGHATGDLVGWDLMAFDLAGGTLTGLEEELVASARLDDQASCWAAIEALRQTPDAPAPRGAVVVLNDHEEIGSTSATGAGGVWVGDVLRGLAAGRGGDAAGWSRTMADSMLASADMAHAIHPNYPERSEPSHPVWPNQGPVIKVNLNHRYATDAATQGAFTLACRAAGSEPQLFAARGDIPCGSTIGPLSAARLAIPTVDVGMAQLGMHSARELAGADDPDPFRESLTAWMAG